jgi:hypothetical protein
LSIAHSLYPQTIFPPGKHTVSRVGLQFSVACSPRPRRIVVLFNLLCDISIYDVCERHAWTSLNVFDERVRTTYIFQGFQVKYWIAKVREEKRKPTAPPRCESGGSGRVQNIALNEAHSLSATPEDCVQAGDTTKTVAVLEPSKTIEKSHCCSCQVEEIIGICMRETHPSVQPRVHSERLEPLLQTIFRLRKACCSATSLTSSHIGALMLIGLIRRTDFLICCSICEKDIPVERLKLLHSISYLFKQSQLATARK